MKILANHLQPLLSLPQMTAAEQRRTVAVMRRMYRKEKRLRRLLECRGPRRFLAEAIAIANRRGDEARNRIVVGNLRLMVWYAKQYLFGPINLDMEELVCIGYERMLHAVPKYKPGKQATLGTYLGYWFRSAFSRATGRDRLIRERMATRPTCTTSLDADIGIVAVDPETERQAQDHREDVDERLRFVAGCLPCLDARERHIVSVRYGLDGMGGQILEDVGATLGVTRERVRQIEVRALGRLQKHVANPIPTWADAGAPVVTDRRAFAFKTSPPVRHDLAAVAESMEKREVIPTRPNILVLRKQRRMERNELSERERRLEQNEAARAVWLYSREQARHVSR